MAEVSNERNFLAPLLVKGHSISTETVSTSVENAKKRIAEALGHTGEDWNKGIWFEILYDNNTGVHKITGTLLNNCSPIKGGIS